MNEKFIKIKSLIAGIISIVILFIFYINSFFISRIINFLNSSSFAEALKLLMVFLFLILALISINIKNNWKYWSFGVVLIFVVPLAFVLLFFFTCATMGGAPSGAQWGNSPTPIVWILTFGGIILVITIAIILFRRTTIKENQTEIQKTL